MQSSPAAVPAPASVEPAWSHPVPVSLTRAEGEKGRPLGPGEVTARGLGAGEAKGGAAAVATAAAAAEAAAAEACAALDAAAAAAPGDAADAAPAPPPAAAPAPCATAAPALPGASLPPTEENRRIPSVSPVTSVTTEPLSLRSRPPPVPKEKAGVGPAPPPAMRATLAAASARTCAASSEEEAATSPKKSSGSSAMASWVHVRTQTHHLPLPPRPACSLHTARARYRQGPAMLAQNLSARVEVCARPLPSSAFPLPSLTLLCAGPLFFPCAGGDEDRAGQPGG